MKVIMKIGGSVATYKDYRDFPLSLEKIEKNYKKYIRTEVLNRIAKEIREVKENFELILVHGGGIFGHYLIDRVYNGTEISGEIIHKSVEILNREIVKIFDSNGLSAVGIPPYDYTYFDGIIDNSKLYEKSLDVLREKKIPVTFGDCIKSKMKTKLGYFAVVSGDDLIVDFSNLWEPDKVIIVTDVDGVYTSNPKKNQNAKFLKKISIEDLDNIEFGSSCVDVTGSMENKIKKLFSIKTKTEIRIVNGLKKNSVKDVLSGKDIGTLLVV